MFYANEVFGETSGSLQCIMEKWWFYNCEISDKVCLINMVLMDPARWFFNIDVNVSVDFVSQF
jgi:hypothetical protein